MSITRKKCCKIDSDCVTKQTKCGVFYNRFVDFIDTAESHLCRNKDKSSEFYNEVKQGIKLL